MPFRTATWFTYASRSERQTVIGVVPRVSQNAVPISDRYVLRRWVACHHQGPAAPSR